MFNIYSYIIVKFSGINIYLRYFPKINSTFNNISRITCKYLRKLTVYYYQDDISMFTNLKSLDLGANNRISDLALLNLTSLNLGANNRISDISTLTNLTQLDLGCNNTISDISTLNKLTTLILGGNTQIDPQAYSHIIISPKSITK